MKAKLPIDSKQEMQLKEITTFNIEARYDDYKHSFYKKATLKYTTMWVKYCEELHLWLLTNY